MILAAYDRIAPHSIYTPLLSSPFLDRIAKRRLWVKAECLQHTGSFKFRGGWSAISALKPKDRARGVITFSSGNHAQGIASAAAHHDVSATIIMPSDSPDVKIKNTKDLGAKVILYNRKTEDRNLIETEVNPDKSLLLIKPYDDHNVIAGQGSVGIEIAAQAKTRNIKKADVLVCSGGGLLSRTRAVPSCCVLAVACVLLIVCASSTVHHLGTTCVHCVCMLCASSLCTAKLT